MQILRSENHRQNYWQLGIVAGTALGLPGMIIGGQLHAQYGPKTAFLSVVIGNFILWIIGLSIISMVENRSHAIQNIRNYLGTVTGYLVSLVWVSAFILWFSLQIQGASLALGQILSNYDTIKIGSALGFLVITLGCLGRKIIYWISLFSFPILSLLSLYVISTNLSSLAGGNWELSWTCILSVVLVWLAFGVNLPTFFQYSRSKQDSILGLTIATVLHIFFQSTALVGNFADFTSFPSVFHSSFDEFNNVAAGLYILTAYLSVNLLNIYFASTGWGVIFRKQKTVYTFLALGLLGTILYICLETHSAGFFSYPIEFLEKMSVSFIASLAIVLLIDLLLKLVVKHRPRPFEKLLSSCCWGVGCITAVFEQSQISADGGIVAIKTMVATATSFLLLVFVEETIWSIKKISLARK